MKDVSLEKIFLVRAVAGFALQGLAFFAFSIAIMPWGILGIIGLTFALYVVYRLVREHLDNPEDRHYEGFDH